jgi:hypothetical protein
MRYTVRYYNGVNIINDISTNLYNEALHREIQLREQWGKEGKVWIADKVMELMVG